jgi:tagatose-1,6-bisphosphate aldolase non-catalytic subunit AgaZ/GatZ
MASAVRSYQADVEAGFHLLHVDPTRDPSGAVPLDMVIERSLDLARAIEQARRERGLPAVSYEIGTEETSGGLTAEADFAAFITTLLRRLHAEELPRPAFIVGQTGTLIRMQENIGTFDAETARRLAGAARENGLGFKEHNADYLSQDILAAHPELGVTAANVAPEFGAAETRSLFTLADREDAGIGDKPDAGMESSHFRQTIEEKVLASRRWLKWLRPAEKGTTEADLRADHARLRQVAEVSGHYVFTDPEVRAARRRLYANASALGVAADPEREVLEAIKASIAHYVEPFRLAGLTTWLRRG